MKGAVKVLSAFVIWTAGSLFLTRLWLSNPDTGLSLPASWWQWMDGIYGSRNAEEIADLEFLVGFMIALLVLAVASALALYALRLVRRQQA
jgi:hypothetical protein